MNNDVMNGVKIISGTEQPKKVISEAVTSELNELKQKAEEASKNQTNPVNKQPKSNVQQESTPQYVSSNQINRTEMPELMKQYATTSAPIEIMLPEIKYPVYKVITPQNKDEYLLRTLTVDDMTLLRSPNMSEEDIPHIVMKMLWQCIVSKPAYMKTYEDFIANLTFNDRQALLFGLFHITEGEVNKFPITCSNPKCGKQYEVNFPTEGLAHITFYDGDDRLLDQKHTITLPISKFKTVVVLPTVKDEFKKDKIANQLPNDKPLLEDLLCVEKFILPDGREVADTPGKLRVYRKLPKKDQRAIAEAYKEKFDKWTIVVEGEAQCPFCGYINKVEIDYVELFFRLVY